MRLAERSPKKTVDKTQGHIARGLRSLREFEISLGMKASVSMSEVLSCDIFSSISVSSFAEMINDEEIESVENDVDSLLNSDQDSR